MEIRGNKVILSSDEERKSRFPNPIDLDTFDLHAERLAADTELDRILQENSQLSDEDYLRGPYQTALERAQMRSELTHQIGKQLALQTLLTEGVDTGIADIERFLNEQD